MAKIRLTPEGHDRLQAELASLTHVRRQEMAERIRQAREEAHGDAGDSTAYEDAKTELAILEQRIAELERTLAEMEIIEDSGAGHAEVTLGAHVVVQDRAGEHEEYVIVDPAEADPRRGRISMTSPVGQAVLGHRPGDEVTVETPAGSRTLVLISVR
jgi:transcription elongation factor GreA